MAAGPLRISSQRHAQLGILRIPRCRRGAECPSGFLRIAMQASDAQKPSGRTACSYRTLKTEYRESDMKRHRKMKFFLCEEKSPKASRGTVLIARYGVDVNDFTADIRRTLRVPRMWAIAPCRRLQRALRKQASAGPCNQRRAAKSCWTSRKGAGRMPWH